MVRFFLFTMFLSVGKIFAQNDFQTITQRVAQMVFSQNAKALGQAENLLKTIQKNGSWQGIDYQDETITNWVPIKHLENTEKLTVAYALNTSPLRGNKQLFSSIEKALAYWVAQKPKSKNWWHNDIATPKRLGRILCVMSVSKKNLPKSLQKQVLDLMAKATSPAEKTGANKLDIAMHNIYRAAITQDADLMHFASEQAFDAVRITQEEGIQRDYSYQQHGAQMHIASYGLVFLSGTYTVAAWLVGTPYALSAEKQSILDTFFLGTFASAVRGSFADFNILGRGISRPNEANMQSICKPTGFVSAAEKVIHPTEKTALNALKMRILQKALPSFEVSPAHRHFWRSDYTLHKRPAYTFSVRAVSKRTKRTERGNDENIFGTFLPDASTNIQVAGNEYDNIMPVWEWDKIPGVTSKDYPNDKAIPKKQEWGIDGSTDFVGGVSDGLYGATAYVQDYDQVTAKKAYFFFEKSIVCLGAGIENKTNSAEKHNITTTLNQTLSFGQALYLKNGQPTTLPTEGKIQTKALWHNKVGYFFPNGETEVFVSDQIQKGSWERINSSKKKLPEQQAKVFKCWLSHGENPQRATYAYVVMPGLVQEEFSPSLAEENIQILSNTEKVQGIHNKALGLTQIIFYEPAELLLSQENIKIKTNDPCALQLKKQGTNYTLSIADPTQKLPKIELSFTQGERTKNISIALPQGDWAGSTLTQNIEL